MGKGSELERWAGAVGSEICVLRIPPLMQAMNHSPSETPRLLHVDTHSRQLIRCVTQHVSMTEDEPDSSSPTHPPVPPTHSPTQTHTELSLFSHLSPSPQQTAVGRPSIATVRRDGPLGFEFQMTEQWSWYGHQGSCWGTVLPLFWLGPNRPAPKPLLRISSLGAQYHQTWWQTALVQPSQINLYFQSRCWL